MGAEEWCFGLIASLRAANTSRYTTHRGKTVPKLVSLLKLKMSLSEITSAFFKASPTRVISKSAKMSSDKPQFPAMDVRYKAENEYQRKMNVITPPHLGIPQQVTFTTSQLLWKNIAMASIVSTPTKQG